MASLKFEPFDFVGVEQQLCLALMCLVIWNKLYLERVAVVLRKYFFVFCYRVFPFHSYSTEVINMRIYYLI